MSGEIRFISLKNNGGFVVKIRVNGGSKSYNYGGYFAVKQEKTVDLAEAVGYIKDGDEVWLEAVVKAGYNNKAKQRFIYRKSSNKKACYSIKGTTLNNSLSYNGIKEQYTIVSEPIRAISLKNNGGFVARIRVNGGSKSFNVNHDIVIGQEKTIDLAEAIGVIKDGDEVCLETVVVAGYNNKADQRFIYRKTSNKRACYIIKGTTLNNSLSYNGIEQHFVKESEPIRFISLKNDGGFVVHIRLHGDFGTYDISNDICVAQEKRIDLANFVKIKDNQEVWLEAVVKCGSNQTARERFIYKKESNNNACYSISGSTLINKLSYNDTSKVGVLLSVPARQVDLMNKIDNWKSNEKTACAWPGILKSEIVSGLNKIVKFYFETNRYVDHQHLGNQTKILYSGVCQGNAPICGPVAAMFCLAKLNINTFVDVVISLYETGSLMGYKVPSKLRNQGKKANNIEDLYKCYPKEVSNVCWMFQSSLAQKESIFPVKLEDLYTNKCIVMHTRHEEMVDDVKFMFNATDIKQQKLVSWSSKSKALNNLNDWKQCLSNSGLVLWEMHADALQNVRDNTNKFYTHVDVHDLHWVVVSKVVQTATDVTIDLHSWGMLYRITVSHDEFQKMSYSALMFISK